MPAEQFSIPTPKKPDLRVVPPPSEGIAKKRRAVPPPEGKTDSVKRIKRFPTVPPPPEPVVDTEPVTQKRIKTAASLPDVPPPPVLEKQPEPPLREQPFVKEEYVTQAMSKADASVLAPKTAEEWEEEKKTSRHAKLPEDVASRENALRVDLAEWKREREASLLDVSPKGIERHKMLEERIAKAELMLGRTQTIRERDAVRHTVKSIDEAMEEKKQEIEVLRRAAAEMEAGLGTTRRQAEADLNVHIENLQKLEDITDSNMLRRTATKKRLKYEQDLEALPETMKAEERLDYVKIHLRDAQDALVRMESAKTETVQKEDSLNLDLARMRVGLMGLAGVTLADRALSPKPAAAAAETSSEQKPAAAAVTEKPKTGIGAKSVFAHMGFAAAAVLAASFRGVETLFSNVYKLTMNPQKFFSEAEGRFKKEIGVSGGMLGTAKGIKWLLVGDADKPKEK